MHAQKERTQYKPNNLAFPHVQLVVAENSDIYSETQQQSLTGQSVFPAIAKIKISDCGSSFFIAAHIMLCFGYVTKIALKTHQCFGYC